MRGRLRLTRLDRAVIGVVTLLLILIAGTISLGDKVGVQVVAVAPLGKAHTTSLIRIRFKEAMNPSSVVAHFRTGTSLKGTFSWSGDTMTFRASEALKPGSDYTVYLDPGATSETGREVLLEYRYSFTVAPPQVAYLAPADGQVQNVWIVDPADPAHPRQITHAPDGVYNYGVSPDGTQIAFAENNRIMGTSDIKLIDLSTGATQQITHCDSAICTTPVWRPDGTMISYERVENDPQFGSSPPRIWLINMTASPPTTQPLFADSQILGYDAQWSADSRRIALVDRGTSSIVVYDFNSKTTYSIGSESGSSGAISPDGTRLVYAETLFDESGGARTTLHSADIDSGETSLISDPSTQANDQMAEWSPDGTELAIAREDDSIARATQIVVFDLKTGATTPITQDQRYSNLFFWWDPTGTQLVVQRFPELDANLKPDPLARPEIWTLDSASGALQKLATNSFMPHWVP